MINIVAFALIIYSTLQIYMGIATIRGKFDPLLPKERRKLPAKIRKKARMLNAISMFATSGILYLLGIGMLLDLSLLIQISAVLMIVFIIVMAVISIKLEAKHLR